MEPKAKAKRTVKKVKKVVEEVVEDLEKLQIENDKKAIKIIEEITLKTYKKIGVYVYYEGCLVDTLKYIKEFQAVIDKYRVGSQIVICTKEKYERIGMNNCYHTETVPKKWTDICLSVDPVCAVRIKERPRYNPEELFEKAKCGSYADDFVEIIEY